MKFVESILSNNTTDDHCQEFVAQRGLRPLVTILGLPNLPVDFPTSAACQAVAGVCKSILVRAKGGSGRTRGTPKKLFWGVLVGDGTSKGLWGFRGGPQKVPWGFGGDPKKGNGGSLLKFVISSLSFSFSSFNFFSQILVFITKF